MREIFLSDSDVASSGATAAVGELANGDVRHSTARRATPRREKPPASGIMRPMEKRFDVFGMCNALFDIQAEVTDDVLNELSLGKGGMTLISEEDQRAIVPRVYTEIVNTEAGGSGANTMIGVAMLGGTACYTSRVGTDEHGRLYRDGLARQGVKPNLGAGDGDTGISLILVTPDTQRTMCTFLGESRGLHPDDVNLDDLWVSRYLYVTGYLWDTENQK